MYARMKMLGEVPSFPHFILAIILLLTVARAIHICSGHASTDCVCACDNHHKNDEMKVKLRVPVHGRDKIVFCQQ